MSAGVLLLAAGSKGKRKIGANCRVMIHSVIGGNHGSLHNLENEMDEIRNSQENYVNALVRETNLTKRTLKRLLERKVNVYLSATEAVEYGIADIIV
jgi:ATP-dependent Clp protease protease subunit